MKKLLTFFLMTAILIGCIPLGITAEDSNLPFIDVKTGDWFYEAVEYSYNNGIFKGTNTEGTEFSPLRKMTRAEFATTLFRASGANEEEYSGNTGFSDVPAGKWMSAAVKWAAEMGYVKGTGGNKFNPNGTLDRQQLVTMLYRFVSKCFDTTEVDAHILDNFSDGSAVADWARDAMIWTASEKLLNGNDKGMLVPANSATRAQVAQILYNFYTVFNGTDSTGLINSELVFTVNNQKCTEPKNIIVMIGDGMGYNIIDYTEHLYKDELYRGKLAMNYVPLVGCQTTYSADAVITDSAASSTAIATGFKTNNETVGLDINLEIEYKNILERSAEHGKSTGVVVTKWVTDATPADFTAHNFSRFNFDSTAKQQMEKLSDGTLDVLLGGGIAHYHTEATEPVLNNSVKEGFFNYTTDFTEAKSMNTPMLGLFAEEALDTFNADQPTLAEMTSVAIDKLSSDENGFFLMVEGSQIDTFAGTDLEKSAHETFEFDKAVAVVLDFIKDNPDTVLIITADHETGSLVIPEELDDSNMIDSFYIYDGHSCRNVPIRALGCGTEVLSGTIENVEIGIYLASLYSEETGAWSTEYNLLSKDDIKDKSAFVSESAIAEIDDNGVIVNFAFDHSSDERAVIEIPVAEFNSNNIKNARAIHVELTNVGDEYCALPSIRMGSEIIDPHLEYLKAGEKALVTYMMPVFIWQDDAFAAISDMQFLLQEPYFAYDPTDSHLLIGDITVTDRELEN